MRLPGLFKGLSYPRAVIRSPALVLPGATKKQGAGSGSGGPSAANQTDQEAASSTAVFTSPGTQQFHPGHPKAWVRFNAAGTMAASYNIASVTDSGVGDWTVNIATDFSSGDYCGISGGGNNSAGIVSYLIDAASAAGTFNIGCFQEADSLDVTSTTRIDPTVNEIHAMFAGDQA